MSSRRTTSGGRIDRNKTVHFSFDGRQYSGHPGDTLASALLANGVSLFGRSFKYHRPRGLLSAGIDEPNALMTVLHGNVREPNVPATQIEIQDGLQVLSQNRNPSLAFDISAVNQLGGKLIGAGFYYKTFMGPVIGPLKGTRFWMFCEKFIRRAAGLGHAGREPDTARYERVNAFCDVLVVGSGPAGLAAARAAAEAGADVMLAELDPVMGGSAKWSHETIDGMPAGPLGARTGRDLERGGQCPAAAPARLSGAIMTATHWPPSSASATTKPCWPRANRATACGPFAPGRWCWRPARWSGRSFSPGNDRPGVMLASAAERYVNEFGVLPGSTVVLFTNNDTAYRSALALKAAGANIATIVDVRSKIGEAAHSAATQCGAKLMLGARRCGHKRPASRQARADPALQCWFRRRNGLGRRRRL
jgi:sarcosine oxidase subunit alpha